MTDVARTKAQIDARPAGITKARLAANATRPSNQQFAADADYVTFVCTAAGITSLPVEANDSYVDQYASQTVAQLQAALDVALAAQTSPPAPAPAPAPLPADALAAAKVTAIAAVDGLFAAKCITKSPSAVCNVPAGLVQCDLQSRANITGAVVMAMLAAQGTQPFAVQWTMADNTSAALDGPGMITMGLAVGKYVTLAQYNGQALKKAINAATTPAAVAAVDITAGWPVHG